MRTINRLLCLSLLFGLASFHAKAQAQIDLQVMTQDSPDFYSVLNSNFPGILDIPGYRDHVDLFVLLRNNGVAPLHAYSIIWERHLEEANYKIASANYVRRIFTPPNDNRSVRAGEIRLVTPLFNVSPKEYTANLYFKSRYPANLFPGARTVARPGKIVSLLDAAVSGMSTTGPNKTHFLERYRCIVNADRDAALWAMSTQNVLSDASTMRSALKEQISSHSHEIPKSASDIDRENLKDLYRISRLEIAERMLGFADDKNLPFVRRRLQAFLINSPFHKPSPFAASFEAKAE